MIGGTHPQEASLQDRLHDIEHEVRAFISDNFILPDQELGRDDSLTRSGILDSMGVLELIMFIEERFAAKVPDEDAVPENLDSVARIVRYVAARRIPTDG